MVTLSPPGNNILMLSGCGNQNSSISDFVARGRTTAADAWKKLNDDNDDDKSYYSPSGRSSRSTGAVAVGIVVVKYT